MPVKEISAESVRDKSIRNGHISTLHLWWARRPLPVCRAVVFASLVPDPLDVNCSQQFKDCVELLLMNNADVNSSFSADVYKPYDDIPFTAIVDPMEDNLRNRLMMFIGKFSDTFLKNEKVGEKTPSKDQISDYSLIKWENKNNESIIVIAQKLIWVAYNSEKSDKDKKSCEELLINFEEHLQGIKKSEKDLFLTVNRHILNDDIINKESLLASAIEGFLNNMPKVFDPFAGGGAIPLEAARLGCKSFGNDINPVAHIIQKGSLEYPQRFGKEIRYSIDEYNRLYDPVVMPIESQNYYGDNIIVKNRLSHDVEYWAKILISRAHEKTLDYYKIDKSENAPILYYWARVGVCSNPSCMAHVPLLKQFYLSKRRGADKKNYVYLNPIIKDNNVSFEIKNGECDLEGWNKRTNLVCPCCGNVTDSKVLKKQFVDGIAYDKLLVVVYQGEKGKDFRISTEQDLSLLNKIPHIDRTEFSSKMQVGNNRNFNTPGWGVTNFNEMFNKRQFFGIYMLITEFDKIKQYFSETKVYPKEYSKAVSTYIGILIDRIIARNNSFCVWHILQETVEHPFGRQAIPMVFDYPEMNMFSNLSGACLGQLPQVLAVINSESGFNVTTCSNSSSGDEMQFKSKYITATITDPPYFDAIAYADLSDFFYLWLKRTLKDYYPLNFSTPQTPKSEECTALKHHHLGDIKKAEQHFEAKLKQVFIAIEKQTNGLVSIMFAHQSTKAWSTLCNSILLSNMNISASWANDTEITGALKSKKATLATSVTVSCRPIQRIGIGEYRKVKRNIDTKIRKEVKFLYELGYRGADLLTACFGQAVGEFGQYETVEKADGSEVTVVELLEMAREAAFNAIISDIDTDDATRFYIGWLNLFGFSEATHDDVRRVSQIGLSIDADELVSTNILHREGSKEHLTTLKQRIDKDSKLGQFKKDFDIDKAHRAMWLYVNPDRQVLLQYVKQYAENSESSLWRVINSLGELLPPDSEDGKAAMGLLSNKEMLIRESKSLPAEAEQESLF
ncbi:MAG: DUF1156 domain-containing protein [Fibrobacterales bacterium]